MNRYRIVIKTYKDDSKKYFIQYKFLGIFWKYLEWFSFYHWDKYEFDTLEEAKEHVNCVINYNNTNKVVKTELYEMARH